MKVIVFLTGTRADFGKLKPLILEIAKNNKYVIKIFITGMHTLSKYGSTYKEIEILNVGCIYKFINQSDGDGMDHVLAKTIMGFADYCREVKPDLVVIHGDRVEALAGAAVASLNNILVAHIEGGEVSGTIDELIRHSVTKLAHLHFVSNDEAAGRLIQLGELQNKIYIIGSPDFDVMRSSTLPNIEDVKRHYQIKFEEYAILLFHPVTTELNEIEIQVKKMVNQILQLNENFIVVYPNNDAGSDIILREYKKLEGNSKFRIFPSISFEKFLVLLKNSKYVVGNSSAGIKEAPFYGVPSINIGNRQHLRSASKYIINVSHEDGGIADAVRKIPSIRNEYCDESFGVGDSAVKFAKVLSEEAFWNTSKQKYLITIGK